MLLYAIPAISITYSEYQPFRLLIRNTSHFDKLFGIPFRCHYKRLGRVCDGIETDDSFGVCRRVRGALKHRNYQNMTRSIRLLESLVLFQFFKSLLNTVTY